MKELLDAYDLGKHARGFVRFQLLDPKTGVVTKQIERHNLVLYSGADILASLLAGQGTPVNAMYMEFKNMVTVVPITPPAFDRTGGIAYYNGLSSSPDTDFVRLPLLINPTVASTGVNYQGNQVTFFGISEGLTGFFGKPFTPAANSTVYGAALVSAPSMADQTQDRVFARIYTGIDQITKEIGQEIGITWVTQFN